MTRRGHMVGWLVALGVVARVLRLGCRFPLWSDEAAVALNLYGRGWDRIFLPLDYHQVAPKLFLAVEKLAMAAGGGGEISLRLLPCLASIIALILFAKWAMKIVAPTAALCAVALAALSTPVIDLSAQMKPYALDLLATVVILHYADRAMRAANPWKSAWPLLVAIAVMAGFSFASLLVVAGAISVGGATALLRRKRYPSKPHGTFWLAAGLVATGAYVLFFRGPHLSDEGQAFMQTFWSPGFPPRNFLPFFRWFITIHVGDMFDYPTGGVMTIPAMVLSLLGAYAIYRRRPALFALLLSPFVVTFIAAALHQYPYGWKVRMSQQFAPSIWIFASAGIASLISRLPRARTGIRPRRLALVIALCIVMGIGATAVVTGFVRPYEHIEDAQERAIAQQFFGNEPAGTVLFASAPEELPRTFLWYLHRSPQLRADMRNFKLSPQSTRALLIAIEPSDDAMRRTILSLYPGAVRSDHTFPGRAAGTMVYVTQLN